MEWCSGGVCGISVSLALLENVGLRSLPLVLLTYLCMSPKKDASVDHASHASASSLCCELRAAGFPHEMEPIYMSMLSPPLAKLKFCCCC